MKMTGEQVIPAPRQRVWDALNDPEVLKQSIPGCQEMTKHSPTEFEAKVVAKVGPVKANFAGTVTLSQLNPPESYVISGQGKGGAAGFAKGGASVRLEEAGDKTRLTYDVDAQVGGKLAQIGSRLIDSTARKMADDFFRRFARAVAEGEAAAGEEPVAAKAPAKKAAKKAAAKKTAARKSRKAGPEAPEPAAPEPTPTPSPMPEAAMSASAASRAGEQRPAPREAAPTGTPSTNVVWMIVGAAAVALLLIIYLVR